MLKLNSIISAFILWLVLSLLFNHATTLTAFSCDTAKACSIGKMFNQSSQLENEVVMVKCEIIGIYNFGLIKIYAIKDGNGDRCWVRISQHNNLPDLKPGQHHLVCAEVKQLFKFNFIQFTVLSEINRENITPYEKAVAKASRTTPNY